MKKAVKRIWPFMKNKYILISLFFAVWLVFFDQNNLIDRVLSIRKYSQMEKDVIYYKEKIKLDTKKLEELRTDRENLEKFAREQYYMKKDNEDIFIVTDE
jgi:cell division protein DivIC